ncbi:MAG: hypothetical protein ACTSXK_13465 [Promethearchaeota archaeon]
MFYNARENLFKRNEKNPAEIAKTDSIFWFIFASYNLIIIIFAAFYQIRDSGLYLLAIPIGLGTTFWIFYRVFIQKIYYTKDIMYLGWFMILFGGLALVILTDYWDTLLVFILGFFDVAFIMRQYYDSHQMVKNKNEEERKKR